MRISVFHLTLGILVMLTCVHCIQAPLPNPPASTEVFDLDQLEQSIHQLVNKQRSRNRLDPLNWNDALSELARAHSADMLERDYFSHNSPGGQTPADRADQAGFDCTIVKDGSQRVGIGENIITTYSFHSYEISESGGTETVKYNWKSSAELAEEIVSTWMNSSGHRRNILSSDYIQEGLGAVAGKDQKIYVTQNFC